MVSSALRLDGMKSFFRLDTDLKKRRLVGILIAVVTSRAVSGFQSNTQARHRIGRPGHSDLPAGRMLPGILHNPGRR